MWMAVIIIKSNLTTSTWDVQNDKTLIAALITNNSTFIW